MTRDLVNRVHRESMSMVGARGEVGEAGGLRGQLTSESSRDGRSGGGYVVGNT